MEQIGTFLPFILMFVVIYFFMILPQQKRMKKEKEFEIVEGLVKGKEVEISSGVFAGYRGIVLNAENKNQIAISIELLNRTVILHLKEDSILVY